MSSSLIKDIQYQKLNPKPVPAKGINALQVRSYAAALATNLLSDWIATNSSADIESRTGIRFIRNRTRDLERNEDYTRAIVRAFENNIIGHNGFKLSMRIKTTRGGLNRKLNSAIETAYAKARRVGNWDVTGCLSGIDADKLILRSIVRDGDCLIRKVPGYNNPFKFAIQLIEADHLDENYVWNVAPDRYIRMGVEMDEWRKPLAYHLWKQHPGDLFPDLTRIRIPADELIHPFIIERIGASRGISQLASSAVRLRHLSKYEESEVVAARAAACKMGFFERDGEFEYQGDSKDDSGNPITEFSAGTLENLPMGVKFASFDPQHPNGNLPEFRKAMLRGASSGTGVSYNSAFNDLEGVNFSSMRAGELDERDTWLGWQVWFRDHVTNPIFLPWLKMAIMTGQLKGLSIGDAEEIAAQAKWRGRRWDWVDPLKDVQANTEAVNSLFKSRTRVIEDQGDDLEDVAEEIADENELFQDLGIAPAQPLPTGKEPLLTPSVDSGQPADGSDGEQNNKSRFNRIRFTSNYDDESEPGETLIYRTNGNSHH